MARVERNLRYSNVAIAFHWVIAALIIVNITIGLLHDSVPLFRALMPSHFAIGLSVLVLTAGRVAWRLAHRPPPLPSDVRPWERGTAHAAHWTLYLLLLVMPLTGWAMMAGGRSPHPISWFGLFTVPLLPTAAAAGASHSVHVVLGWSMAGLVLIHIGAALRHHFIRHDAVLARMAPALSVPRGASGAA